MVVVKTLRNANFHTLLIHIFNSPHACFMPFSSNLPSFDDSNNSGGGSSNNDNDEAKRRVCYEAPYYVIFSLILLETTIYSVVLGSSIGR